MKVALVHDWLVVNGGAEKVLEELLDIYPKSDIYTLVDYLPADKRSWLGNSKVYTSFVQKLPGAKKRYRSYLPLFPIAIEQFDLSSYDLIISSSYAVAKGVITGPDQTHISYCHSPARYAWDLQAQYLKESGLEKGFKSTIARYFLHKFRIWDVRSSFGVDRFIANSNFIANRIKKCYRRDSTVIYPPVDISRFSLCIDKQDYYVTASRLVPYKRIDIVVEAFTKLPGLKLKVLGDGPEMDKIRNIASGFPNIEILGYQSDESMLTNIQQAKAFVFAAEEDFGIIPVEAQASGTPVIAYGKGGCLETVVSGVSGIHFDSQTVDSLLSAIETMEASYDNFKPEIVRNNALQFSVEAFKDNIQKVVKDERG
ncbi:glycosyltransferase family 4 protein [Vibrio amylolyticus]|uniref:glycosyltransferase family 4 protein n=1 Tax=Vibrio amylolyticus TaxID=2847292 RepID=UPI00354C27B4